MALEDFIKSGAKQVYRRMFIKRVRLDGTYEPDWFEISEFVVSYGTIVESYGDNLILGSFSINNLTARMNNGRRRFNDQDDAQSFFFQFLTRIKTRFKIECGFIDQNDDRVLGRAFYGISFSEPTTNDRGTISFRVANVLKVFQRHHSFGVSVTPTTSSTMVDRLVKLEQNGVRIFDQFFEGADDVTRYQITPSTDVISAPLVSEDQTVWDKIKQYSTYENFFPGVTADGNFEWKDRNATIAIQFNFNGAGAFDDEFGVNIISIPSEVEGVDETFTRAVIEHSEGVFAVSEGVWTPGDGSVQDIYGERTYEESFFELDAAQALIVAQRVTTNLGTPRRRWIVNTTFIPQLKINDRIKITELGEINVPNPFILGVSVLGGTDVLGERIGSILLDGVVTKVSRLSINLDDFSSQFELTEI